MPMCVKSRDKKKMTPFYYFILLFSQLFYLVYQINIAFFVIPLYLRKLYAFTTDILRFISFCLHL